MTGFKQYLARVDELSLRERVVIFSAVLLVLFLGWYTYLLEPQIKQQNSLQTELDLRRGRLQEVSDQFSRLAERQRQDPDADNRARIAQLRGQIEVLDGDLEAGTAVLISPEDMPGILRQVLNKTSGLTLESLTGLGSTPLVMDDGTDSRQGEPAGGTASLYRHGMQIDFSGGFPETLEFIRSLEGLKRGFFWDRIDYRVEEYPQANVSVTLYTLSLNGEWIRI